MKKAISRENRVEENLYQTDLTQEVKMQNICQAVVAHAFNPSRSKGG